MNKRKNAYIIFKHRVSVMTPGLSGPEVFTAQVWGPFRCTGEGECTVITAEPPTIQASVTNFEMRMYRRHHEERAPEWKDCIYEMDFQCARELF